MSFCCLQLVLSLIALCGQRDRISVRARYSVYVYRDPATSVPSGVSFQAQRAGLPVALQYVVALELGNALHGLATATDQPY